MRNKKIINKNFYVYLQKHYAGKLVAFSKDETKVYATANNVDRLMSKLKVQKIQSSEVIIAGPIEEYGKIYVYLLSVQNEDN